MTPRTVVSLGALVMLLVPSVARAQDTFDQYAPLRQRWAGMLVLQSNGSWQSQWSTNPTGATTTDVTWTPFSSSDGPSTEEWEVKQNCSGGNAWVWLDAFRDANGNRYPITTTKAIYIDINTGQSFDITSGGACGTNGQPYAVYNVYNSPYIVRVWGWIWSNGAPSKQFFWQEKITQFQSVTNPCWSGGGGNVRTAIRQDEAWWDSQAGWAFNSGGSLDAAGVPNGFTVYYGRYQTIAKGVGFSWTYQEAGYPLECLVSQWSW